METRGVASVRSPVCNLRQRYGDVTHEGFVRAVVDTFREEYGVREEVRSCALFSDGGTPLTCFRMQVHDVEDSAATRSIGHVRRGMEELKVSMARRSEYGAVNLHDRLGTGHSVKRQSSRTKSATRLRGEQWYVATVVHAKTC